MLARFLIARPSAGQKVRLLKPIEDPVEGVSRPASQPVNFESVQVSITDLVERCKDSNRPARNAPP